MTFNSATQTETPNSRERNELTFSMPSCENRYFGDWLDAGPQNLIKIKSAVFAGAFFVFFI